VSQNICGEWYFPWHSHALNEFANFDEGFGGMATLLRVDPPGGCFAGPTSTTVVGGAPSGGTAAALALADTSYHRVNPKTTTRPTATTAGQTSVTVASASGFPTSGAFHVRIGDEVLQVTGGQGTTTWTVTRGQLGTAPAAHSAGATVTALGNDWYAGFTGIPRGAANLKVTYTGQNCANTTGATCTTIDGNPPVQTVRICDWTVGGAAGCATPISPGWVTPPSPPAQPQAVGSTAVTSTWSLPGPAAAYVGTGANAGQIRVLVQTRRVTAPAPAVFSTWGNLMKIVYDAP